MKSLLHTFDSTVTNSIVGWPASLKPLFLAITALGDPIITVGIGFLVITWGYLQTNVRMAFAGATIWLTLGVGAILKLLFDRERPVTEYTANLQFPTLSFPSGHASGATIAYGLLAYLAWHLLPRPWNYIVTALLIVLIVLIGVSRIYLGAHFPSDVVAGWLLGGLALLIIVFFIRPLS